MYSIIKQSFFKHDERKPLIFKLFLFINLLLTSSWFVVKLTQYYDNDRSSEVVRRCILPDFTRIPVRRIGLSGDLWFVIGLRLNVRNSFSEPNPIRLLCRRECVFIVKDHHRRTNRSETTRRSGRSIRRQMVRQLFLSIQCGAHGHGGGIRTCIRGECEGCSPPRRDYSGPHNQEEH